MYYSKFILHIIARKDRDYLVPKYSQSYLLFILQILPS